MKRLERLLMKIMSKDAAPDFVAAYREAGYAVGAALTVESLGSVSEAELRGMEGHSPSAEGPRAAQAKSRDHLLTERMAEQARAFISKRGDAKRGMSLSGGDVAQLFEEMRASGIDLDQWFRARVVVSMSGPIAVARFAGTPLDDVYLEAA